MKPSIFTLSVASLSVFAVYVYFFPSTALLEKNKLAQLWIYGGFILLSILNWPLVKGLFFELKRPLQGGFSSFLHGTGWLAARLFVLCVLTSFMMPILREIGYFLPIPGVIVQLTSLVFVIVLFLSYVLQIVALGLLALIYLGRTDGGIANRRFLFLAATLFCIELIGVGLLAYHEFTKNFSFPL